jgi:hypothetical protein
VGIGASVVAKAPPDGYTLVVNSSVPVKAAGVKPQ